MTPRRGRTASVVAATAAIGLTAALALSGPVQAGPSDPRQQAEPAPPLPQPNIVLVLMDDASMDLMAAMAQAQDMASRGATYRNAFVVDSLCCVSRTVILTGQYPHQTGVLTNTAGDAAAPRGGWTAFTTYGNGPRAVNVALHDAGYTTGFVGKFLNQYRPPGSAGAPVPPGWSEFGPLFEGAYDGWDFDHGSSRDGAAMTVAHQGAPAATASASRKDAASTGAFIQRQALDFLTRHRDDAAPYFLEIAVYAPHDRATSHPYYAQTPWFPAMYRDRPTPEQPEGNCGPVACTALKLVNLPGYADPRGDNRPRRADGSPAPAWQRTALLPPAQARRNLRQRARMVQSVDRLLEQVLASVDEDTYVILTSDNGLHLDQWGMARGKGTAYDSDIHVPLVVVGPGVVPGVRDGAVTNLDLAATLEELAGLPEAVFRSGTSFAPSLTDPTAPGHRYVFVEHSWSGEQPDDPDAVDAELASIPTYVAVRSAAGLLIRYDYDRRPGHASYAWELYDYAGGNGEATNVFGRSGAAALQQELRDRLRAFLACRTATRDDAVSQECRHVGE